MRTTETTARAAALRRLVHVGKRDLGLADDQYRDLLAGVTGQTSSTALSAAELDRVVERMKALGFKVKSSRRQAAPGAPAGKPRRVRTLDLSAEGRKVRALWLFLHTPLGLVRDSSEAALGAYVRRMTGVDALQWTSGEQIKTVIESLKKWAMRALPDVVEGRRLELLRLLAELRRLRTEDETRALRIPAHTSYASAFAAYEAVEEAIAGLKSGDLK